MDGSLVSPPATGVQASGAAVAPDPTEVLALFQQLLPLQFFWTALQQAKVKENNRVYNSAVVVWLMLWQRLRRGRWRARC